MHRNRKITIFFLSIVLLLSLIGCSQSASQKAADKKDIQTELQKTEKSKTAKDQASSEHQAEKPITTAAAPAPKEQKEASVPQKSNTAGNEAEKQPASSVNRKSSPPAASSAVPVPSVRQQAVSSDKPAPPASAPVPIPAKTVTFSIAGPKEDHSADLSPKSVKIKDGYTLLNVLLEAVGKSKVDYSGSGSTVYVSGISNIYEFDYGAKSGWVFKLNGVSINKSIGVVSVKNGDRIECLYTE